MISIIICSRETDVTQNLKNNIAATIGCDYELLVIDNSNNGYNIHSAYNEGVRLAKGDYLCFMHDDILFRSENWGRIIEDAFVNDKTIGCLGVVGTHFLPNTPCGWYHPMLYSGGCIQNTNGIKKNLQDLSHFHNQNIIAAVTVDGMWFCIPRFLFEQRWIAFDTHSFNGFHCYDLDICLQIQQLQYKVMITSQVLVEHSSYGSFNMEWWEETKKLHKKWQSHLPQNAGIIISDEEKSIRTRFVEQVMVWLVSYAKSELEKKRVLCSKSYRLGRFLLQPLRSWKNHDFFL